MASFDATRPIHRGFLQLLLLVAFAWRTLAVTAANDTTFDFIVVGGGTAGLAVASRLSTRLPSHSVLVIEAGPDARTLDAINIPGLKGSVLGSVYDWNFTTTRQPGANNRSLVQNRGRVLGGSSALNLLSWDRGAKGDYDAWEELGNPGWNWDSMYPAMKNAEHFQPNASVSGSANITGVGYTGPCHVLVNKFSPEQQEQFFPTMQNLGMQLTTKFLQGEPIGLMHHTSNIFESNYTRSYAPTYLNQAGSNLYLMINTTVAKVNVNGTTATGVTLQSGAVITASKEVIVSAGSIQSPALLEISGIGNSSILRSAGITPIIDLPGVGENLQDHVRITTAYQLRPNYTSIDILRFNATRAAAERALYNANLPSFYDSTGTGYTYMTWHQALGDDAANNLTSLAQKAANPNNTVDQRKLQNLVNSSLATTVPQLEILFSDGYLGVKGYPIANSSLYGQQFFALIASIQHPFSRGSVHINSTSPTSTTKPIFNPNYLSNDYDVAAVTAAAKYLRTIASTPPLVYAWVNEYEPGFANTSTAAEWETYARNNVQSIWHPLGTCAMLPKDQGGVVDTTLKVYGTDNLRVVDASIMPSLISGHLQTGVYGIGERAAAIIAAKYGGNGTISGY